MGGRFCASTIGGLYRSLTPGEKMCIRDSLKSMLYTKVRKNNMKKIIAAAVVASMVVPCFSVSAAERVKEVSRVYGDKSEIHIVYNDKVVKYDDVKPVNTDGRVMIPFRAALENMLSLIHI